MPNQADSLILETSSDISDPFYFRQISWKSEFIRVKQSSEILPQGDNILCKRTYNKNFKDTLQKIAFY